MPTFGSLFSGVGGLDLGLERAGWECRWQVEIDDYRRGILERHWPGVPRWDDVRTVGDRGSRPEDERRRGGRSRLSAGRNDVHAGSGFPPRGSVDLICGGFPCQDLSVAGRRKGLQGERSSLFFEFARIAGAVRPPWLLIENVPGLLSSHRGRDFAIVLATLADLGYGVAWRVLDSRYFGVPQRRRRVFIVGHLGARSPEPFLAFLEGGEGDPPKSEEAGQDLAAPLGASPRRGRESGGSRFDLDNDTYIPSISYSLTSRHSEDRPESGAATLIADPNAVTHALTSEGHDASEDGTGRGTPLVAAFMSTESFDSGDPYDGNSPTLRVGSGVGIPSPPAVAFTFSEQSGGMAWESENHPTLQRHPQSETSNRQVGIRQGMAVRRLTPTECCRLQGFPDDWLGTPNEPPDSPRYAAMGDAVTVPVAEWIGRRLLDLQQIYNPGGR